MKYTYNVWEVTSNIDFIFQFFVHKGNSKKKDTKKKMIHSRKGENANFIFCSFVSGL